MGSKFILFGILATAALPFVLVSLVSQLTRVHLMALVAIGVVVVALAQLPWGRTALAWVGHADHFMPILGLFVVLLAGWMLCHVVVARRRRRTLSWTQPPSQTEFATGCVARLFGNGWIFRGHVCRIAADIYWLTRPRREIMIVFCVGNLNIPDVRRGLSQYKRTVPKEAMVVMWRQPSFELARELDTLGWRILTFEDFVRLSGSDLIETDAAAPRRVAMPAGAGWDQLRQTR